MKAPAIPLMGVSVLIQDTLHIGALARVHLGWRLEDDSLAVLEFFVFGRALSKVPRLRACFSDTGKPTGPCGPYELSGIAELRDNERTTDQILPEARGVMEVKSRRAFLEAIAGAAYDY